MFIFLVGSLNSDVWSENFKRHLIFRPLNTEKFTVTNPGFWSILFNVVLKRQNHSQNVEKSRHVKKSSTFEVDVCNFKRV